MHHFVLVLVPAGTQDIKMAVSAVLAPYKGHEWDSWHIGGRYDGAVQGKSQNTKGQGNQGSEYEQLQYNICPVRELPKDFFVWEIVTPDGQWHQGEWWKTSFGVEQLATEQAREWRKILWGFLEQYSDCIAVGVDTHL